MERLFLRATMLSVAVLCLSCARQGPRELIVGRWNATVMDRTNPVEIREDGTMLPRGGPIQYWVLEEGDSLVFRMGPSPAEMVFAFRMEVRSDTVFTLTRQGRTSTFRRID